MPQRRMIARSVVESDAFCEMPLEAQMLYLRLMMAADDDGFVSNPRTVMRAYALGDEGLRPLLERRFVLALRAGALKVCLIRHWLVHNRIPRERYRPGPYRRLLEGLERDENGAYLPPSGGESGAEAPTRTEQGEGTGEDKGSTGEYRDNKYLSLQEKESKEKEAVSPPADGAEAARRAARIARYADVIGSFERFGCDASESYARAAAEGISAEEIRAWIRGSGG